MLSIGGGPDDKGFEERLVAAFEAAACSVPDSPGAEVLRHAGRIALKNDVRTSIQNEVHRALTEAAQACRQMSGVPNTEAVLKAEDLNGDGGEDWIADYAKLRCDGGINQMCDDEGCVLQIFLWNGAAAWNLAFDDPVKSYKFVNRGGKRLLQVTKAGSACDKPATATCRETYILDEDAIELAQ